MYSMKPSAFHLNRKSFCFPSEMLKIITAAKTTIKFTNALDRVKIYLCWFVKVLISHFSCAKWHWEIREIASNFVSISAFRVNKWRATQGLNVPKNSLFVNSSTNCYCSQLIVGRLSMMCWKCVASKDENQHSRHCNVSIANEEAFRAKKLR